MFDIQLLHDSNPATRPSPQHYTTEMVRQYIGSKKYDSYYKFAFVRNPWSRILSSYFWRQTLPKKRPVLPFDDFIYNTRQVVLKRGFYDQEFGDHFIPQTAYTNDVDDVFRFEDFVTGIETLACKLGVCIAKIPPKKPKHYDNYQKFYTEDTRSIIAEIYSAEIEEFDYDFEETELSA